MKNTWKGIKNLISLKTVSHSSPASISYKISPSPCEIENAFSNYFSNVALNTQFSIKYVAKERHEFLPSVNKSSFFMSPADKNEIIPIISVLDSQKTSGPNCIPINILKLMKNNVSDQLAVLFELSLSMWYFSSYF